MVLTAAATAAAMHLKQLKSRVQKTDQQQTPRPVAATKASSSGAPSPSLRLPVASAQNDSDDEDEPLPGAANGPTDDLDGMSSEVDTVEEELDELRQQLTDSKQRESDAVTQVSDLQQQVAEFESELEATTISLTELRKTVDKQLSARVAAEKHAKELETRISGMLSARGRMDDESLQRLQDAEDRAEAAEAARQAAEEAAAESDAEVDRLKEVASSVQRKVQATADIVATMSKDLERAQHERDASISELEANRATGRLLEEELASLKQRLRQTEGEVRVSKENLRRMDDRMRGILRERSEMAAQIKQLSPSKPR